MLREILRACGAHRLDQISDGGVEVTVKIPAELARNRGIDRVGADELMTFTIHRASPDGDAHCVGRITEVFAQGGHVGIVFDARLLAIQ